MPAPKPRAARTTKRSPGPGRRFVKGQVANPTGYNGAITNITDAKRYHLSRTGMTPLDFMAAVWRDELYDKYDVTPSADGRMATYAVAKNATKIECPLRERLAAAVGAAPYLHRRMPIGVESRSTPLVLVSGEELAALPESELDALLQLFAKLGLREGEQVVGSGSTA